MYLYHAKPLVVQVDSQGKQLASLFANEPLFHSLFAVSPLAMTLSAAADGCFFAVNASFVRLTGYEQDEVIHHTAEELGLWLHPEERLAIISKLYQHGSISNQEVSFRIKDGQVRTVRLSATLFQQDGRDYVLMMPLDVTVERQKEQELRQNKERFQVFLNNANDAIFIYELLPTGQAGRFIECNSLAYTRLEYSKDELLKLSPCDIDWQIRQKQPVDWQLPRNPGDHRRLQTWHITKNGRIFPVELHLHAFAMENRLFNLAVVRDISEQHETAKRLQQSEYGFKQLAENSPDIILRFDREFRILYANPAAQIPTGLTAEECIGRRLPELKLSPTFIKSWCCQIASVFNNKKSTLLQSDFVFKRRRFYYQAKLVPELSVTSNEVESVLCTIRNITDLKKAEAALRRSQERMQNILNSLPDRIFILQPDGLIVDYQAASQHPSDNPVGQHITAVLPAAAAKVMAAIPAAIRQRETQVFEYACTYDNSEFCEARLLCNEHDELVLIVRNVTELRRLQNELARLDRLNLVGEIAVSIGHEIRNPMTTVRGFVQLLQRRQDALPHRRYYDIMLEELDRANMIITEFLSLAKDKALQVEVQDLNVLVQTLAPLLQADALLGSKHLKLDLHEVPPIAIDAKEIRQLILNMARNAWEVLPAGGTLTLRTYRQCQQVILAVEDTGPGMPPEICEKLGTPFFSTKDNHPGLGLAIAYSIAARHKATIDVVTGRNGTIFHVAFPVTTA